MGDSMWSSYVCNALNSSMKLAVLLQTSNTLIIDGSLLGAAVLYQTANKMRNGCEKEAREMQQREGGSSAPLLLLRTEGRKQGRHLNSESRGKWCRAEALGVMSLNLPEM